MSEWIDRIGETPAHRSLSDETMALHGEWLLSQIAMERRERAMKRAAAVLVVVLCIGYTVTSMQQNSRTTVICHGLISGHLTSVKALSSDPHDLLTACGTGRAFAASEKNSTAQAMTSTICQDRSGVPHVFAEPVSCELRGMRRWRN